MFAGPSASEMLSKLYTKLVVEGSTVALSKIPAEIVDDVYQSLGILETGFDDTSYEPLLLKKDNEQTFWRVHPPGTRSTFMIFLYHAVMLRTKYGIARRMNLRWASTVVVRCAFRDNELTEPAQRQQYAERLQMAIPMNNRAFEWVDGKGKARALFCVV